MPKMDVINQEGKVVGSVELKDEIFGIEPNQQCMYDAVVMQLASRRQGTHCTKGRSEVSGGASLGVRKVQAVLVREASVLLSGEAEELYSDLSHVIMAIV